MVPPWVITQHPNPGDLIGDAMGFPYVVVVVIFGFIWVVVNTYQYYPLCLSLLLAPIRRLRSGTMARRTPMANGGEWPDIDLLLPAYDEASVIEQAIRSVYEAAYPADHLQIHVLTEPDDQATRDRLRGLTDRYNLSIYRIPPDYPGEPNKPRALNFGYTITDGDIVGVLDAEDVVAPDLFDRVVTAFRDRGCDYALAHLDMANEDDGWLNLLFRAEYGFWYEIIVPAFARVGYPVPLGGASCFFRREVLEAIAERRDERFGSPWRIGDQLWLAERGLNEPVPWDPANVTEDFELGLFLWEEGYRFEYLDVITTEESPVSLEGWLDQRVRWQKGKLQTFQHYLDHRPEGVRKTAHIWWQSALPHLGPVNVLGIGIVFWLATVVGVVPGSMTHGILQVGLAFFLATTGLFVAGYWRASDAEIPDRTRRAVIVGITVLFYWVFQWLADLRALLDVYRGRFEWTPSEHFGRHFDTAQVAAAAYVGRPTRHGTLPARLTVAGLATIVGLAVAFRAYAFDRWSLWHDEIYTITVRASAPVPELLGMVNDPHPPLFYLIAKGWMVAFGGSPTAMRTLSLLFSAGTVVAVFLLGRRVYDDRTGLLAALIVAVSTMHVHFGRTVRMYSLFTLLAALSWYLYVGLRTDGRCFDWLPRAEIGRCVAYVLISGALLYTHVYGLFVIASQHLVEALSERGRIDRRVWWTLQLSLGVMFLPWASVLAEQVFQLGGTVGGSPIAWIPEPSMGLFRETMLLFGGYPSIYPILGRSPMALAIVGVSLFVISVGVVLSVLTWDSAPERTYYLVDGREAAVLGLFIVGVFIPFGLSYVLFPIFVPRYAIAASIPLFILVARGLLNVPEHVWRRGLIGVLLVGAVATTGLYYTSDTAADWRGVAHHLSDEAAPGDLIVFQPTWLREDIDYYALDVASERYALRPDDRLVEADLGTLQELADRHDTVWLVQHTGTDSDRALELLRERKRQTAVIDGGIIRLYRFESSTLKG